jgi:succinate dehydrogenase/fumarate reductase flavoprotein subunit
MPGSLEADFLVIGGGMAGMTAAFYAASQGASVAMIEKAPEIGGSAVLSGAHLWTARSFELLRDQCPSGDPELGRALIDGFAPTVEWIRGRDITFGPLIDVLHGRGYQFDVVTYFRRGRRAVESSGGWVLPSCVVENLLVDDAGRVAGARVRDRDGFSDVTAPATLLATGGFQANLALREQYFGPKSAQLLLRSNPWSSGDGLRLGLGAGAVTCGKMDTFYGHLIGWPLGEFLPKDFVRLALVYSTESVLVNLHGKRFTDESLGDHRNAQRVAEQPSGRALIVFDRKIRETSAIAGVTAALEAIDTVAEVEANGARVASADSFAELGDVVSKWGYHGAELAKTLHEFNARMTGPGDEGVPGRRWNRRAVGVPPFTAIEVKGGITFTQGGLRVDTDARVQNAAGSPIDGLFAAGADIGGVYDGGYAGGLALASVYGLAAAKAALAT